MNDEGNAVLSASALPGHGMSYIKNALFKLLGVDKKAEELYALEQMKQQLKNKPYYRQKERY